MIVTVKEEVKMIHYLKKTGIVVIILEESVALAATVTVLAMKWILHVIVSIILAVVTVVVRVVLIVVLNAVEK